MTLVLVGKGLVLGGSTTKIEDKQVPGIYISITNQHHPYIPSSICPDVFVQVIV